MKRLAFSDDMMRALAAGEKTMTRRMEKRAVPPESFRAISGPVSDKESEGIRWRITEKLGGEVISSVDSSWLKPRFNVGDLVAATCAFNSGTNSAFRDWKAYRFQFAPKDLPMFDPKWKPARIMPAAFAPFVLRITDVRAEKLGEIADTDVIREGMMHWQRAKNFHPAYAPREMFAAYWTILYGDLAFDRDSNSWVWVYGFEIAERRLG